ncbi:OLC1v1006135C2 [Oldenlandia corymbosa var. corymbosa]|uniref:OLC1v1006135C2 n=1 Tax=Oldenlandia corymbosa var. corymbosa TaxID=529605 RepID=A0AAV1DIN1_OLDCO|nr:OLC1v1006135C2 [Oldenlandia corymbosa var. corymbosa]
MVMIMMHPHPHHHQITTPPPPPPSHHNNPPPFSSPIPLRSPNSSTTPTPTAQSHSPSFNHTTISLGRDNYVPPGVGPVQCQDSAGSAVLTRVKLSDILPYDGSAVGPYVRAVEALSGSLMRHNAAVIEVGSDDAALLRCGLESARFYLRTTAVGGGGNGNGGGWNKSSRRVYVYRPGRTSEDKESPPCMADVFRCMGKAARAALCAIARHLRLRSDVFNHLLDDSPLPANEASSSSLIASLSGTHMQNGKGSILGGKLSSNSEMEKGLLTLMCSDSPGFQVCDPNGRWYMADNGLIPGELLLLTGKALSHATAGLRPAASYRFAFENSSGTSGGERISLAFRLMPQRNAVLDCSPIAAAGHVIPQSYVPISVTQFMDELSVEEDVLHHQTENAYVSQDNLTREPSLRSILSDPVSGAFLEDAMLVSCGHSFGGTMLRRVLDTSRCTLCSAEIDTRSLVPNHALRAAAAAVKQEDDRRRFHNSALRKRRKEGYIRENGDISSENGQHKGVKYPFSVDEKVIIRGNRRTPDKFVGREAIITSQCLNGWLVTKLTVSFSDIWSVQIK